MTWGAFTVAYRNGINKVATNSMARNSSSTTAAGRVASTTAANPETKPKVLATNPLKERMIWEKSLVVSMMHE